MEINFQQDRPFRVLALDGGGMRGLYSATVLHYLARRVATEAGKGELDVGKGFDLITGTSTGGLLGCALAHGCSTSQIMSLYQDKGSMIFKDPTPANGKFYRWAFRNRKKSAACAAPLREELESLFGGTTLEDLYCSRGIALCIPVTNVSSQKSQVFKTPHLPSYTRDRKYKLVDVCMATSAAPFFFPLAVIDDPTNPASHEAFADGGLWANSPVLVGLIEAVLLQKERPIQIISVSTCAPPTGKSIERGTENWGVRDWKAGVGALELSLEAQSAGHLFMAKLISTCLCTAVQPKIIRLPSSPPSSDQAVHIGLDRADSMALNTLQNKARDDADMIPSQMERGEGDLDILKEILTGLPEMEVTDGYV